MSEPDPLREVVDFHIDEERPRRDVLILVVRGEADLLAANELRGLLAAIGDEEASTVIVDLTYCTFIDSTFLSVLVQARRRLRSRRGDLRLVVPRPARIRRIFELTMLDRVLVLESTRREAIAAVGTETGA